VKSAQATTDGGHRHYGVLLCWCSIFVFIPFSNESALQLLPLLGEVLGSRVVLMLLGISWALIIIHPLPMLSDMAGDRSIGHTPAFITLHFGGGHRRPMLFTAGAVQPSGKDYNAVMLFSPISHWPPWL